MNEYLRLDMCVNGREYLIAEAPVSVDGYEACLNASDVITSTVAHDIRTTGGTLMDKAEQTSGEMLELLWGATGKEICERDEITFCMCLWNDDEHIRSLVAETGLS